MGGYGSGRWHYTTTKRTVEDCLPLSADKLARERLILPDVHQMGTLTWHKVRTGEVTSTAGFEANTATSSWLRLHYTIKRTGEALDYKIPLTSTKTPWGALRWWFICPLVVNGRPCQRRVGKLYLPPGGRYYGCRHCHNLTYTSCNESHKDDAVYRMLARDTGWTPSAVKRILKGGL